MGARMGGPGARVVARPSPSGKKLFSYFVSFLLRFSPYGGPFSPCRPFTTFSQCRGSFCP